MLPISIKHLYHLIFSLVIPTSLQEVNQFMSNQAEVVLINDKLLYNSRSLQMASFVLNLQLFLVEQEAPVCYVKNNTDGTIEWLFTLTNLLGQVRSSLLTT